MNLLNYNQIDSKSFPGYPAKWSGEGHEDSEFRYTLWRVWGQDDPGICNFLLLNPSTAWEQVLDPTLRRCKGFAKRWGFGGMCVTNIFAFRSPEPSVMKSAESPVGPENNKWIERIADYCDRIVAGWGAHGDYQSRDKRILRLLEDFDLQCLGVTNEGQPRHPLYLKKDEELIELTV